MRIPQLAILVLVAAATGAGGFWLGRSTARPVVATPTLAPPADEGPVVARWLGGRLTAAELREHLLARKAAEHAQALSPEEAQTAADEAVRSALLATEARRRSLERDPKVEELTSEVLAQRLIELEFDDTRREAQIGDPEVKAFYEKHRDDFVRPEKVHLADLVLPRRQALEAVRKALLAAPPSEVEGLFAAKAKALSVDAATASGGGDLGSLTRPELEERLGADGAAKAWAMMRAGELSEVLEAHGRFHLLRLAGRQAPLDLSLEQARPTIRSRLWYEQRDAELKKFVDDLRAKLALSVDQAALKKVLGEVR